MSLTIESLYSVNDFFESYAKAIESYNTKLMALHYHIPCTMLSDESDTFFTDASKLEGLFNQGINFYKQFGISNVRPEVWSKRLWTDKIVKAKVNWQYFNAQKQAIYNCDYQYILKQDKNNAFKIHLSVSVNEKERMDAWLNQLKNK